MFFFTALIHFWTFYPALFYGLAALFGCYAHFYFSMLLLVPCFILWIPFCFSFNHIKPLILNILIFFSFWFYTFSYYHFPSIPEEGVSGTASLQIHQVSQQQTIFGTQWLYRCHVREFSSLSDPVSFPCIITLPMKHNRPLANQDYWITGNLLKTPQGYRLKPAKQLAWQPIKQSWSWAENRYQWKQQVVGWIHGQFSHETSATFIAGLATGEFHDPIMREQFAYFGLQHLLAISGFHFTLVASLLNFCLRLLGSFKWRLGILLICLSSYCFFLGAQPSILRAWIICLLAFGGELIHKQSASLNALGGALLILMLWNPLFCLDVGFQLSFAVTFAILIFSAPAQLFFCSILTKRSLSHLLKMNPMNQLAYCLLTFFREGMALTLAVNLFALPLTLYYFHQFPLMSLLYNLFFPLLASVSLGLLLIGALLFPLPGLKACIYTFNDWYTFYVLKLTDSISMQTDAYLTIESLSSSLLILYLCGLGLGGMLWHQTKNCHSSTQMI
jgi:competence protein ComEC